ncbi:hypothetical protein FRC0323_01824 [Corynebacterium diphtheriae]|nr:hypothetical protein FRC0323_01824 [Corynebacterium diphtheriae]
MEHHDHRFALLAIEPRDELEHVHAVREVKVRRWLVEEDDVRVLRQHHGDPHALALATGERIHGALAQVHNPSKLHGVLDDFRMRRRPLLQPRLVRVPPARDQVLDRHTWRRNRRLRQHGNLLRELARWEVAQGGSVERDLALAHRQQARQAAQ